MNKKMFQNVNFTIIQQQHNTDNKNDLKYILTIVYTNI